MGIFIFQPVVLRRGKATCLNLMLPSFTVVKGVFAVANLFTTAKDRFVAANSRLVFFFFLRILFVVANIFLRTGEPSPL